MSAGVRSPILIGAWILLLFIGPSDFAVAPLQTTEADTRDYLSRLWTVTAGALTITLSLQVFALQRFGSTRVATLGESLRAFARTTLLLPVFSTAVAAILVIGLALLGVGSGGLTGWAGTYAAALAFFAVLLLPVLLHDVMTSVEFEEIQHRRLARLEFEVQRRVRRELRERIALTLLQRFCEGRARTRFEPFSLTPRQNELRVCPARSGRIVDIDLQLLEEIDGDLAAGSALRIRERLGTYVTPERSLAILPSGCSVELQERVRLAFSLTPAKDEELENQTERLAAEASEASRANDRGWHDQIHAAYELVLLSYPRAWARYRQRYEGALASSIDIFGLNVQDSVLQSLYSYLLGAVRSTSREVAQRAAYLPIRIASEAVNLDASALLRQMCDLVIEIYADIRSDPTPSVQRLAQFLRSTFIELANFRLVPPVVEEDRALPERERSFGLLRQFYFSINAFTKRAIDARDSETVDELDLNWSELLRHWTALPAGYDEDDSSDLRQLEVAMGPDQQAKFEELKRLTAMRRELRDLRTEMRMGLAAWSLRRLRSSEDAAEWRAVVEVTTRHFGSVALAQAAAEAASARQHDDDLMRTWDGWAAFDQLHRRSGGATAAWGGYGGELLRAFVVLGVARADPGRDPTLEPSPWLRENAPGIRQLLDGGLQKETGALGVTRVDERIARFRAAVNAAVDQQLRFDEQEILSGKIDEGIVSRFIAAARESWQEHRLVPALYRRAGVAIGRAALPEGEGVQIRNTATLPKEMLLLGREISLNSIASEMARGVAMGEINKILNDVMDLVPPTVVPDPAAGVRATIATMATNGLTPTVVVKPTGWQLERGLNIDKGGDASRPRPPDYWGIPEGAAHWYRGRIDGVPVFDNPDLDKDIFVIDLGALGTWTQGVDEQQEALSVAVRATTAEEAEAAVKEENKAAPLVGDQLAVAVRTKQLDARIALKERVVFALQNTDAATRLRVEAGPAEVAGDEGA